jgi:methyl coenzyme M reductase gamma subunit
LKASTLIIPIEDFSSIPEVYTFSLIYFTNSIYHELNLYEVLLLVYTMSKMYVKDPNEKYRLVDKETQTGTKKVEARQLSLEEIDARLKRLESIVIDPRK